MTTNARFAVWTVFITLYLAGLSVSFWPDPVIDMVFPVIVRSLP